MLALVLCACGAGLDPASTPWSPGQPSGVATTDQPWYETCHAERQIESALGAFARAVNDGDRAKVDAVVSSVAQWFSITTSNGHEVAYGHGDIVEHLLAMHEAGDRFITPPVPNQLTLQGWDGAGQFGLAPFTFERAGKHLELQGKGAVFCGGRWRGIQVMSLGGP
jgi:hypothetical protein